jgi:hypothetical protein
LAKYNVKYNTGPAIAGTTQSNKIAIATGSPDYSIPGWVAGLSDANCYVFVSNSTDLSITGRSAGAGASTIQADAPTFWKTDNVSDAEVLRVINRLPQRPQNYTSATDALTWIRSSSYYTVLPFLPTGSLVTSGTLTNTTVIAQSPFAGGGNAYYTTGSATSYVSVPGQSGYAFGTDDFTVEWFQYETISNDNPHIFWYGAGAAAFPTLGVSLEGVSSGIKNFRLWDFGGNVLQGTTANIINNWLHFAIVRINGVINIYQNGIQINSGLTRPINFTDSSSTFYIGSKSAGLSSDSFAGFITNFRVVKGIGVYTGNFTKPTSALTAIATDNPYGGANTVAIPIGYTMLLLVP